MGMRLENDIREWGASTASNDNSPFIKMVHDQLGGEVLIPPGNFKTGAPLSIYGGVQLVGQGRGCSFLTCDHDMPMVIFEDSTGYAGMRHLTLYGYAGSDAKHNLVKISDNMPIFIEHCRLGGGNFALENNGIDGYIHDVYTNGAGRNGGGVFSRGANWYNRCKLDQLPQRVGFAFYQGKPIPQASSVENHLELSDFSGNHDHSLYVNDEQTHTAITVISGGVFANKILIDSALWTCLDIPELGDEVLLNNDHGGKLTIANGFAFRPSRVGGGSKMVKVSNTVNMDNV